MIKTAVKLWIVQVLALSANMLTADSVLSEKWFFAPLAKDAEWAGEMPASDKTFKLNKDGMIDLDSVAGKKGKAYDRAVVYQRFELDKARELAFGITADWWFEVYLNGEKIYASSNKFPYYFVDNHVFTYRGRKGINNLSILLTRGNHTWTFGFVQLTFAGEAVISADKNKILGPIKIMNAINNGPVKGHSWNPNGSGNMQAWQELDIPYGRTHDSAACSNYGGEHIVDVHRIFGDFSKDPYDPASYDFASTDRFLKMIEEGKTKVFYRLGATIEHTFKKKGTLVPKDFKKWAVICEHIIRHYTEGWANGYKMDIKYWEIWNEPDLRQKPSPTWGGTQEQFFELYRTTALHLKKCFPHLKIGGPAMAGGGDVWMRKFLEAMTKGERVPLDFFSWHIYTTDSRVVTYKAKLVRDMLDEFGYNKTESILNEWNYVRDWTDALQRIGVITGHKGAAFTASVLTACQQSGIVDMLMYYDGRPSTWNGLFRSHDYHKLKTYYVFLAWKKLRELGKEFAIDIKDCKGLYAVGATDGKKIGIMLTRYYESDRLLGDLRLTLQMPGVDFRGVKVYAVDENNDFADVAYRITAGGDLVVDMKALSMIYIEK